MRFLNKYIAAVEAFNDRLGRWLSWCLMLMTIATLAVIFFGYFFQEGWIWLSEAVVYMHGALFMLAAAYTLQYEGHVRIDVFYQSFSERKKCWVNILGVFILLIPTCMTIFAYSFPYVAASWAVRETSAEGEGIPAVFLLKTCILLMPLLMILQGLAMVARCVCRLHALQHSRQEKD